MSRQLLYKNGLPFSQDLALNLDRLIERVDKKKASLIIIDGGVGEGKTTILIHVLDYINKKRGLPPIDLAGPQRAVGGDDFVNKLALCYEKNLPCIGYDEAGDFNKRGSLTKFNSMLNRTFETFRAYKCIVVMTLPYFNVIDDDLFKKGIPRLYLNIKERTEKYGNFYGYSLYRMMLLKYWFKKLSIQKFAYSKVHSNFRGHFLDLDPERSKLLDKIGTQDKLDILRKNKPKASSDLLKYEDLAKTLDCSVSFLRKAVTSLNIQEKEVFKNAKYFDPSVVPLLADYVFKKRDMRTKVMDDDITT